MTPTEDIPLDEMCFHAKRSLKVNGLTPSEWRWGPDAVEAFRNSSMLQMCAGKPTTPLPKVALLLWHNLPVFPMRANGVACVAGSTYKEQKQ